MKPQKLLYYYFISLYYSFIFIKAKPQQPKTLLFLYQTSQECETALTSQCWTLFSSFYLYIFCLFVFFTYCLFVFLKIQSDQISEESQVSKVTFILKWRSVSHSVTRGRHTYIELAGAAKIIQIEVQVQHTSKRKSDMEFLDLYEGGYSCTTSYLGQLVSATTISNNVFLVQI